MQTIFGVLGGIGPHPEDLMHMRRTADRLFGKDYQWSILAAGRHQINLATIGASMGGNVRVGLEDSIYLGPGRLAKSNAEQVRKIRTILEELSLEIATPEEARKMLKLKGGDQVALLGRSRWRGRSRRFRGVVYPWFCDFMGHMNTQFYCTLFDGATLHFLAQLAKTFGAAMRAAAAGSICARCIEYKHEVRSGELLLIRTQLDQDRQFLARLPA